MKVDNKVNSVIWMGLIVPFIIVSHVSAYQPVSSDTSKARELMERANRYYGEAKRDSAIIVYNKAREIYTNNSIRYKALKCRIEAAKIHRRQEQYEMALEESGIIVSMARRNGWTDFIIDGEVISSLVAMGKGDFKKGLNILNTRIDSTMLSEAGPYHKGFYYSALGQLYDSDGSLKRALQQYKRVLSLYEKYPDIKPELIISVYNNIGIVYRKLGEFDLALEYYKKDIEFIKESNVYGNPIDLAIAYNNIGGIYYKYGDYGEAINYYTQALNKLNSAPTKDWETINMALNNIGVSHYQLENYAKALSHLEKALDIKLKIMGAHHPHLSTAYLNLGAIYTENDQTGKALDRFSKAKRIREKRLGENHPKMVNIYEAMGGLYFDLEQFNKAETQYRKSLEIQLSSFGKHHPQKAYLQNKIGKTLEKKNNHKKALRQYEQALNTIIPSYNDTSPLTIGSIPDEIVNPLLLDILQNMAGVLHTHYLITRDIKELNRSYQIYKTASAYLDRLQYKYRDETSKLHIAERSHKLHGEAIATSYTLYRTTDKNKYKEQAFHFAEKSRYRLLDEISHESNAKEYANIPDSLTKFEQRLKSRLTKYNQYIARQDQPGIVIDSTKLSSYRDSTFILNRRLQKFITELEKRYPKYYQLKYEISYPDVEKLQKNWLQEDQAIIEYFLGSESIYSFNITSSSFVMKKTPISESFTDKIYNYREDIKNSSSQKWLSNGYQLYTTLLEPSENALTKQNLIIVADGVLHYLPFETLLTQPAEIPDSQVPDYSSMPFLIKDHAISYSLSSHSYGKHKMKVEESREERSDNSLLAIAPTFSDSLSFKNPDLSSEVNRFEFSPLPMAEYEVQNIAQLAREQDNIWNWFNDTNITVWTDKEATEKHIKNSDLSNYNQIHFATHAYVSEENPDNSVIFLTRENDTYTTDTSYDGMLSTSELYNLDLNATLVVLSACQTGYGPLINGEGIMGLTRPLFYSGASNIMVSLWQVSDRPTAELMIEFYKRRFDDISLAEALRQTKLHMIKEGKYAEPAHWSSFILIGS